MEYPQRIGRYEIRGILGAGAMGMVYRAYDPATKREVALKVVGTAVDPLLRARILREARAVATLEHPAVVPLYDVGETYDGQPFIVMRLMEGGTLKDRLAHGPLPPNQVLEIVRRVASALDAAHAQGIVHRDLKPGNVLFDRYGAAYLADFGIARLSDATVTLTGSQVVGTPAYMSPEQAQGKPVDGRADVYALGAVVFECFTGRRPYEGETYYEVLLKHLQEPPPDLREYRPDLPPAVAEVIRRAMAKQPEERYPTAGAMVRALEEALTGAATTVAPTTWASAEDTVGAQPTIEARPARRWRVWLLPLALVVLAALAAGWWLWQEGTLPRFLAQSSPALSATASPFAGTAASSASSPTPVLVVLPTSPPSPTVPPPSPTVPPPTPTMPPPSPTVPPPTPTAATVITRGGADLIAFVASDRNIYLTDVEGRQVEQLTFDGAEKRELQWLDHDTLLFLSGTCAMQARLSTRSVEPLVCFPTAETLEAFRISPDGKQVAISLDGELIVTAFDPEVLAGVYSRTDLLSRTQVCNRFDRDLVHEVRWGDDGRTIAARVTVPQSGRAIEQIELLRVDCRYGITRQHIFPGNRFPLTTFDQVPGIPAFDWDGDKLFFFNLYWRNRGYGDLYLYSRDTYNGQLINPIENTCCYRDPRFSPDGRYLFVAFQDIRQGHESRTALYWIPVGTWGAGLRYQPLPLPQELFSDPRMAPYPALRPAP